VIWKDAFSVESSRKKAEMNVYRTYEAERTKQGATSHNICLSESQVI
jgi:hypothetical protein